MTAFQRDQIAKIHIQDLRLRTYIGINDDEKKNYSLDDIINNAGGSKATDLRIKELVKNLQLTTSVINEEVGFAGVQPLGLRETNAEALILAVMAEKHIGNQYNVERTKDGIKATPLKPNIPIETKDIEYYTLVKNSSSDTINTTNELFDINQQIARIEGGKDFRLGSKLGKLADVSPTMLDLLGVDKPEEMTGESLIIKD